MSATNVCTPTPVAPTPAGATSRLPLITVVVPVRNEARCIASTLAQLLGQSYAQDRFEVIVVDGASDDDTCKIVESLLPRYVNLQLLHNPKRWSSAARNLGIRSAHGELLVIVDGHCDIGRDNYLATLAETFERTGADCIGRPQPLEIEGANEWQQAIAIARESRLGHHPASYVFSSTEQVVPAHSVAVAYRRSVFERVGLFDEGFDACEDVELNHRVDRAGLRCVLAPALAVSYHPRASLRALFRQMERYGRGRMRLLRKHRDTFSPLGFAPALLVLWLLCGPLLWLVSPKAGLFYLATVLAYVAILVAFSGYLATRARRWSLLVRLPAIFATLHAGAGAGVVFELIRPSRRNNGQGAFR